MSDVKLKPCPFCGGEAKLHHNSLTDKFKVWCSECDCRTDVYSDKEEVVKCWNTRKPMERIVDRLEEECFSPKDYGGYAIDIEKACEIVKEEGGIE